MTDVPQRWTLYHDEGMFKDSYMVLPEGIAWGDVPYLLVNFPIVTKDTHDGDWYILFHPNLMDFTEGEKQQMIDLARKELG